MRGLPRLHALIAALVMVAGACATAEADLPGPVSGSAATARTADPAGIAQPATPPDDPSAASVRVQPVSYRVVDTPTEPVPSRMGPLQPREVSAPARTPFATVGGVTLFHPSSSVETIGFHESNHDGARQMELLDTAVAPFTMASRERGTGSRTAADIVVEPEVPIVAPVTGTVLRAGSYTLYCDYRDHFTVIEPDEHPGWEVKILHFLDLQVSAGDRVEAGVTVLGSGPRPLAFRSQVDDATAAPSWPHVHIEVVDPSIPDRPSGTSC